MSEQATGHEPPDVSTGRLLGVVGVLGLFVIIAVLALHLVLRDAVMPDHAQVVARPGAIPPAPRLQPHPAIDIAAERAEKATMLMQYAWTDQAHRYARIPIQRAMQLYVLQHAMPQDPNAAERRSTSGPNP